MTNIIERLRTVAGEDFGSRECRVTNPRITARESIVIADHIVALEAEVEMLRSVAEELRLKYETEEEENAKQQRDMKTKARSDRDALAAQVEVLQSMHLDNVRHIWESRNCGSCEELAEKHDALAAQVSGLVKIVESNAIVHISANTAEISAQAIEQAAAYLSESVPDKSHESVIFKDRYVYISTRYLREHAETIRQGGAE